MKAGTRALGVAESYRDAESTIAGCVVRADRVLDGLAFGSCTVGGTDATATVVELVDRLDREDIQYLLVAGIAPAWFNILDLHRLHDATGLPTLSVSFEASAGLEASIREAFPGAAGKSRLDTYRDQPPRRPVTVDGAELFVRAVGFDDERGEEYDHVEDDHIEDDHIEDDHVEEVVRAFTPAGGRPEPLRVARLAARAADTFREQPGNNPTGGDAEQ